MGARSRIHPFLTLLLVAVSFAGGWWLRGLEQPSSASTAASAPSPVTRTHQQTVVSPASEPNAKRTKAAQTPPPSAETQTQQEPPSPPAETEQPNVQQAFRELLAAQAFGAAINLYRQVERRNSRQAEELKEVVLHHLHQYAREGDDSALTGLVEAFLSYYYDDLDVLLVLANHHLSSGYPSEAARTFQLAFAYAFRQDEQRQVDAAFQSFVKQVDDSLTDKRELIAFYEALDLLDLIRPEHQLRLAELYLNHGQQVLGRNLLETLAANPSLAEQAEKIMARADESAPPVARTRQAEQRRDAVALVSLGSHYHLPLRLNDQLDLRLLIDTGASTTTISQARFRTLSAQGGFTRLGPQLFNTANGVAKGTVYRVAKLQVGRQVLNDIQVAVLDLDMPEGIDGLLGMNVLRNFRFELDQDEQRLYLQKR